jgi:hypothetical protein
MDLNKLKEEFPFKWRVQSFSKSRPMAICVPYCDSRQVQDMLDNVCGPDKWQDKYYELDGVTYCSIGILCGNDWVWKSDCGINEQRDKAIAVKGESSDAFKRAAVKWGIGRFLYSMRTYNLKSNKKKEDGDKSWHVWCVDKKGNKIEDWYLTDYINGMRGTKNAMPAADPSAGGEEASSELSKLEDWLSKYTTKRICLALSWLGKSKSEKQYKAEGVADVARADYAKLCTLVKFAADAEIFDMCLDGYGYKSIADGGVNEMFRAGNADKVLDEFESIKKQDHEKQ